MPARRFAPGGAAGATTAATDSDRKIVAFCCRECAYAAADASANARTPLPPSVRLVLMPCTGRVSPLHLLKVLAEGADGVMVAGCLLAAAQSLYAEGPAAGADYRTVMGMDSRLTVWIAAQLHLMFAAFVPAIFVFRVPVNSVFYVGLLLL